MSAYVFKLQALGKIMFCETNNLFIGLLEHFFH